MKISIVLIAAAVCLAAVADADAGWTYRLIYSTSAAQQAGVSNMALQGTTYEGVTNTIIPSCSSGDCSVTSSLFYRTITAVVSYQGYNSGGTSQPLDYFAKGARANCTPSMSGRSIYCEFTQEY